MPKSPLSLNENRNFFDKLSTASAVLFPLIFIIFDAFLS